MIPRGVVWAGGVALLGLAALVVTSIRQNPKLPPQQAVQVVEQAIRQIRSDALAADGIDWDSEQRKALQIAGRGGRLSDLDEALHGLVLTLRERDGHSFYLPAATARGLRGPVGAAPLVEVRASERDVQVLAVNAWASLNEAENAKAAEAGAALLTAALERQPCGVVIDLRENGGGNMYPMLGALAPLLPPGDLGYFQTRDGQRSAWPVPPRAPLARQVAVAVLIGPGTASSGEFVAIGLRLASTVRFFGAATAGLTTANSVHPLPHGGMLALTVASTLDAKLRPVHGRLAPDEDHTEPLAPAADWVLQQCPPRAGTSGHGHR